MYFGKIGPIAGCLSSICFTLCWIVSALIWEDWTLGSYALSDLGVCGIDSAEIIFNFGCLLTGFLVIFPALCLIEEKSIHYRISGWAALVCSIACAGIGVITEEYGVMHNITASTYAVFAATFMAFSAAGNYMEGKRIFTAFAAVMLITCGILSIATPFAVFEPIAISCILIWTFTESAIFLYKKTREEVSADGH